MGRQKDYPGQMALLTLDEITDNLIGQWEIPAPAVTPKTKRVFSRRDFGPRKPVGVDPNERQKKCTKCRKPQGISCYPKDRSRPDGLHARCRDCHRRQSIMQRMGYGANIGKELLRWLNDNPQPEIDESEIYVPQYLRPRDCLQCQQPFVPGDRNSSRKVLCSPYCAGLWIGGQVRNAFDVKFEERMASGKKVCGKCLQEKLFAEFAMDKTHRDGRTNTCRLCMARKHFTPTPKSCHRCHNLIEASLRRRTKATMCHDCKSELGLIIFDTDKGHEPNRKRRYKTDPHYLEYRKCVMCPNMFLANTRRVNERTTCSKECRYDLAAQTQTETRPRYELICPQCKKPFFVTASELEYRQFCKGSCWNEWSHEHGVERVADLTLRRSKGYTRGPTWCKAKRDTLARDNYTCQNPECLHRHETERTMHVHHVIPFRMFGLMRHKEANALSNLITLCPWCHIKTEWQNGSKYGQWEKLYKEKGRVN